MSILQDRLKLLREQKTLFQKDVAKDNNIVLRTYQSYERGEREPDLDTLIALADYFGVTTDYLTGKTDIVKTSTGVLIEVPTDPEELDKVIKDLIKAFENMPLSVTEEQANVLIEGLRNAIKPFSPEFTDNPDSHKS
jgi:transcriptional regulator with XRE-family HTH domain